MEKGKLLGEGVTAEVYEWGRDKVLKLYFERFCYDEWINHEAKVGHIINEAGVNSPAVYNTVEVGSRKGIIYERIFGQTILKHLETEPWKLYYYADQMANLHHNIHKYSANGIPTQSERFNYTINISSRILGSRVKKIIDYMKSLPDGNSICHGDLHFNNIIVSDKKLIPIDWNSVYRGNPLGDVARTCLIIRSPAVPEGISAAVAMLSYYPKLLTYWTYLNEYLSISKVKFDDIDAWMLPVAAAKLKDNMPGEKKWLLNIIDKRLEEL